MTSTTDRVSGLLLLPPTGAACPIVVSVPHAGRLVPADLGPPLRIGVERLRQLEDPWVDRLVASVPAAGATVVGTAWHRAVADVNRAPDEFDPARLQPPPVGRWRATVKARAGLGVVPTEVAGEPIYPGLLDAAAVRRRVDLAHAPFHQLLGEQLAALRRRFGRVLLLDVHSMPETVQAGARIDVALGDRHGRAADDPWMARVGEVLAAEGLSVAHNRPYAGGYVIETHGRPAAGVHAIQLEIRRSLYMDERRFELHGGVARLARICHHLVRVVGDALLAGDDRSLPIAGE